MGGSGARPTSPLPLGTLSVCLSPLSTLEIMGKLVALTLLGASLAFFGERILTLRGKLNAVSRKVVSVELQNCQFIEGLENGSEDIDILPSGLAFISTGLKYPGMPSFAPDEPGKIFLMDLNEQNPKPQALTFSDGFDKEIFNPHGISTFIDKDHTVYLYVVNHPDMKSTVEIFQFDDKQRSLIHWKTITHELLKSVNDIVAVGLEEFYATRDHYFNCFPLTLLEIILELRWTYVLFYSPREVKVVATGFQSANGITVSQDQKYVYVADVSDATIHIMEIHDNWNLTQLKRIHLGTLPDNLNVDPATGDILAGCHPNALKILFYNPEDPPGSEVLRIQNVLSDKPTVKTVYANNGSVLQGSSVASVYREKMLIGTVFQKALYCVP
ncbi:serum paraoxonase/lactonase 3-like [Perognathus longimembris pacificus]|uniref:serum paraoxonase/lactonase 3-like n=1 Tax=Perognathus longimembris pacificus TaxID=214514 RepID=UPI002018B30B|nr:serum paraoxonase/lactonase 3-like [Perognathus longimembris pacificus]XP_048196015.1 serum paraoxonase/lactonase 3-like [Perognathus longimembris pacificus]